MNQRSVRTWNPISLASLFLGCSLFLDNPIIESAYAQEATPLQKSEQARRQRGSVEKGLRVTKDLTYARTPQGDQKLDLYLPEKSTNKVPVIVFIHGGGWKQGSKASATRICTWLVPHGFAVASINYRLIDQAGWPAQIDDCYAAVRWVRENADQYGLDANAVGVWGTSAGAHLAALVGTRPSPSKESVSSRVQAVCDWFGPADLLTMPPNVVTETRTLAQTAKSNGARMLGAAVSTIPEKAKDASAIYHVTQDDPAFLIVHGDEDKGVPLEQSQRLAEALRQQKVSVQLEVISGAGHGGPAFQSPPVREVVRKFFVDQLIGSGS